MKSLQAARSSPTALTEISEKPQPSKAQMRAMGDVLDRWRLNNGWNPLDDKTQLAAIASYIHELDREGVPYEHYSELYSRAIRSRIAALNAGRQVPQFGVELMLAEWTGPYGLQSELHNRRVEQGRTLTGFAQSQCPKCFGTGTEIDTREDGTTVAKPGCRHDAEIIEQKETAEGITVVEQALRNAPGETAEHILRRLATAVTIEWHAELDPDRQRLLWNTTAKMIRAALHARAADKEIQD